MTPVTDAVDRIRLVEDKVGAAELARLSGVPYTTIVDWKAKEFRARSVGILEKLSKTADEWLAANPEEPEAAPVSDDRAA